MAHIIGLVDLKDHEYSTVESAVSEAFQETVSVKTRCEPYEREHFKSGSCPEYSDAAGTKEILLPHLAQYKVVCTAQVLMTRTDSFVP